MALASLRLDVARGALSLAYNIIIAVKHRRRRPLDIGLFTREKSIIGSARSGAIW